MADSTTTGFSVLASFFKMFNKVWMLAIDPTEVPPNFKIFISCVINKNAFLFVGGRRSFGFFFMFFTPYDYLPPSFMPVVIIVVIMVPFVIILRVFL